MEYEFKFSFFWDIYNPKISFLREQLSRSHYNMAASGKGLTEEAGIERLSSGEDLADPHLRWHVSGRIISMKDQVLSLLIRGFYIAVKLTFR